MSVPSILIEKSTGFIIKHAPYPREDMQPVPGLDPNYEWLIKYTPYESPQYDARVFLLNTKEEVTVEPHPIYSHLNQYKTTYSLQKKTDVEIIDAIQSLENKANEDLIDFQTTTKMNTVAINALIRLNNKLILTAKEKAVLTEINTYAVAMWKNDAEKEIKVKQVTDGLEPNIDEGWEKSK